MWWLVACQDQAFVGDSGANPSAETAGTDSVDSAPDTSPEIPNEPLPVCINEWMPENHSSYRDSRGLYSDWIELHNPTSETVSLDGWTLADDPLDEHPFAFPAGTSLPGGAFLLLIADNGDTFPELPYALDSTLGTLLLTGVDGRSSTVGWGAVSGDFSIARTTDCCVESDCLAWDYQGTPGESNVPRDAVVEHAVALGSSWRFKDDGVELPDWEKPAFDDVAWLSGPAPLGYGDDGMGTTIGYGADPNNKYITSWYRLHFTAAEVVSVTSAVLGVRRDDAAAAYLNGVQLLRTNLPDGQLTGTTLALTSTSGVNETAVWALPVEFGALVEGDNVLAVEVHQHAATSSDSVLDAYFDLYR